VSSHRRSVFGFLVSLYLCTVPVVLGLIALVSPVAAIRLGLPFHALFIVPLAIVEFRSHAAAE
jgi:hypothetical protein